MVGVERKNMELSEKESKRLVDDFMAELVGLSTGVARQLTTDSGKIKKVVSDILMDQVGEMLFQFSGRLDYERFKEQWSGGVSLEVCPETLYVTIKNFKSKVVIDQFYISPTTFTILRAIQDERRKVLSN